MERLMMWRSGNIGAAKIAVVDDLSSWEMIDPSDEEDLQSLSFSESLSEKDTSSDDERTGFEEDVAEEDDDLEGDGRSGLGGADVDHIMTARSSFDQPSRFDDGQNADERSGFKEEVTEEDYQKDERPGFDHQEEDERPGFEENMVPELVHSESDQILSQSSLINQRWRFDEDGDEQPGFNDSNVKLGHSMLPESATLPIDQRWGFNDDQDGDMWPGFDEHSVGLWEYTVQLIGLGQFDEHIPSDPPSAPLIDDEVGNQRSGLDADIHYDEDNEDDSDDAYDLDENLVPFYASNRFGKQRMGKVGKKVYGKKYKRYK